MNFKRMALRVMFALNLISAPNQTSSLCVSQEFQDEVKKYLLFTVPVISVADAYNDKSNYIFLDSREKEEYDVSHIPGAIHIGYDDFDIKSLKEFSKDSEFVVYCSIGYRSEKIGEKIKTAGYSNVSNLYGSIFEWVNQHHSVENNDGITTNKVHTYNKKWSRWITNDITDSIY